MKTKWSEESLINHFLFIDIMKVKEEINSAHVPILHPIKLKKNYPIFRSIGGVNIEIGYIKLIKISFESIVYFFNKLEVTIKQGNFIVKQNFEALSEFTEEFNLEKPNYEYCQGYILNYELINIINNETETEIFLKYKDSLHNTYILYNMAVARNVNNFVLVIKKIF
ncbi:MAG: hypothetical protein ACRCVW_02940 [Brevinema sp.]